MAGSSSCTTRSSVARRRRPAPRSSSNHAARRAATAARVASVALGRCRSACHGWPPTRTLAVDRSPPIPGGARRRPRFGCMKHEPGGRFHVAATEDLITEQRQRRNTGDGPRAHGGSRLQNRQARHLAYAPGPFPLRQEPRDLRLQLAALSRAVSENRLDERLKIYTVPRLLSVDEICYLPIDRTSPRRLSPHK